MKQTLLFIARRTLLFLIFLRYVAPAFVAYSIHNFFNHRDNSTGRTQQIFDTVLTDEEKTVLLLRVNDNLSYIDIAARLNMTPEMVLDKLAKSYEALREAGL